MVKRVATRIDATRNRGRILDAARTLLADRSSEVSMARLARAADVGMATLYRNFAGIRDVLEALYADEVADLVEASSAPAASAGEALRTWLDRFMTFHRDKHSIAVQLLQHMDRTDSIFGSSRDRVLEAGRLLLEAAQTSGEIRDDITIEQILDLVLAVISIPGNGPYLESILRTVSDGLRSRPTG